VIKRALAFGYDFKKHVHLSFDLVRQFVKSKKCSESNKFGDKSPIFDCESDANDDDLDSENNKMSSMF